MVSMGKSIKVNYIYNLIYRLLLIILPIILIPYTSRVLTPDGIGTYNYTNSIVCVFILIASLGTSLYAQKEIAMAKNKQERSKIFKSILSIRTIMSVVITIPYALLIIFSKKYTSLYIVQYIYILANILDISWLMQGVENFKDIALKGILIKVLSVASIFIFVKQKEDLFIYTLIMSLSGLLNSLLLWGSINGVIENVKIKKEDITKHLKPVFMLALPVMAIYVYTYVDKVFLGWLASEAEVGFYSQSENIVKASMTVITALGAVLLPRISSLISSKEMDKVRAQLAKAIHYVILIGLPMILGFIMVSPIFIPWFLGEDYMPCIFLLQLLSPLILVIGLASVTGQAVLIPLNKQKEYTISIFIGAIINVAINSILIPRLGATGASIGTIAAECCVTLVQGYLVIKLTGLKISELIKGFIKPAIAVAFMGVILYFIRGYFEANILSTVIYVIIGALIYFVVLIVTKEEIMDELITIVKRKMKR